MITSIPFYTPIKDLISWLKGTEKKKEVSLEYKFERSQNYEYRWERPDKIQERINEGFSYFYEEDKIKRKRFILVCKHNGIVELVLIKKALKG